MTIEMWITLGVLIAAIILFITEWLRVDVVALGVVVVLMVTGVLTTEEALSGFSDSAVLTIAALFVVGGAVLQTGLADLIGRRILRVAGTSESRLIVVIMATVAILSGFMSDTGTVAVLLPAITMLARRANLQSSKLLIPLSYGALLGGAMTLIGTPPNIIVSDMLAAEPDLAFETFGFFSFTPLGIVLFAFGIVFMVMIGRHLLPVSKGLPDIERVTSPEELLDLYRLPDNLFRLRVRSLSNLRDKMLKESRLGEDFNLSVLQILRQPEPVQVASLGSQRLVLQSDEQESIHPSGETVLRRDDILIVQGETGDVQHAAAALNLAIQAISTEDQEALINQEVGIAELLLPPRSSLLGKTLVKLRFGSTYHLSVLGIHRPDTEEKLDLKTTPLQFGDILLVQGIWDDILALRGRPRDFVVIGQPEALAGAPKREKAPLALLILSGMLLLLVTNLLPIAAASMLAALAMVLVGCVTMDQAYSAIDWKSIVLVAGMMPMAVALEKVGLVNEVAGALTESLGQLGPLAMIAGLFLITSVFTQVLSNTATTVLLAPIALATAIQLDVAPHAFLMAVAVAASMAFASPVASPVNTLVMGAGQYRFGDYIKVGVPMIILSLVLSVLLLPVLFPL